MFAADEDSTNSTKLTEFDLSRLDELEIGGFFDGELSNWRVLRYKDSYNIMLFNCGKKREFTEHKNKEEVIKFLNS